MTNPDSIALAAGAESEGLEAVLVGGNAVNLQSYCRKTFDVDLYTPCADRTVLKMAVVGQFGFSR